MSKDVFNQVKDIHGYPCVTLILPTHRSKPESLQDPTRLANLMREAHNRLAAELGEAGMAPIAKQMEQAEQEIDHNYNREGLVVFANAEMHAFARLPFDVEERVIVDHNFATRDLIRSFFLSEAYYVMTLSWDKIRLFRGQGEQMEEVKTHGFPVDHNFGVTGRIDWSISGYEDAQIREFFNQVDKGFFELYQAQPGELVLAGVKDNMAHYRAVADHPDLIFAEIHGNFDDATPHQVAQKAWPTVREQLKQQKMQSLDELDAAFGAKKVSTGVQEVYRLAQEGRGHKLLVEKGYFQPARLTENNGLGEIVELDPSPEKLGSIDDLVDEIAEQVIEHKGKVVFLDDGTLQQHDRIALILRY